MPRVRTNSAVGAGRPPSRDIAAERLRAGLRQRLLGAAPFRVGRYELGAVIGTGGFGSVHRAFDPELQRDVAVKVVRLPLDRDPQRAADEARAMARIEHPNVVDVYDVGVVSEELYVVMELVTGGTLRTWLETPRPRDEVLTVLLETGRGLAASHGTGIVHHDFKPDNVLMTEDGRPRVTDFGLSALLDPESTETLDPDFEPEHEAGTDNRGDRTARGGTLGYTAPERLAGRPGGARSDQFSWCVTAYEALVGVRPFAGRTHKEIAASIARGIEHQDPAAWNALDRRTRRALLRGLDATPANRFASMTALLDAIEPRRSKATWVLLAGVVLATAGIHAVGEAPPAPTASRGVELTDDAPSRARIDEAQALADDAVELLSGPALASAMEQADAAARKLGDLDAPRVRASIALVRGVNAQENQRNAEALAALERAFELGRQADAVEIVVKAAGQLAFVHAVRNADLEQAETWARSGLAVAERSDDPSIAAALWSTMAQIESARGKLEDSIALYQRGLELFELRDDHRSMLLAWLGIAEGHVGLGHLDEADAALDQAGERLPNALEDDPSLKTDLLSLRGRVAYARGDLEAALAHWTESVELAETLGRPRLGSVAADSVNAGHALMDLQRADQAELRYRKAADAFAELGDETPATLAPLYSGLARSLYVQQKDAEADQTVERGLLALEGQVDDDHILWADLSLLRGQLRLDAGELESSAEAYARARRCFVSADVDWGIALADFGLGQVALARGDRTQAKTLAEAALAQLPPARGGIALAIRGWLKEQDMG